MKNLYQTLKVLIITGIAISAVSYVYAADWQGPTAGFPGNNVEAPINTASSTQIKRGILQLGVADNPLLGGDQGFLGGLIVDRGATLLAGDLSVGTTTLATTKGLMALFNGKIGATQYCDTAGANCLVPGSVTSGSFGAPDADSGWVDVDPGSTFTFNHNLNTQNTFVYIEGKDANGYVNAKSIGGENAASGFFWRNKTNNSIEVVTESSAGGANFIRVRMWKSSGSLNPSVFTNLFFNTVRTDSYVREIDVNGTAARTIGVEVSAANMSGSCTKSHTRTLNGSIVSSSVSWSGPVTLVNGFRSWNTLALGAISMPANQFGLYKFSITCGTNTADVYLDFHSNSGATHEPDYTVAP